MFTLAQRTLLTERSLNPTNELKYVGKLDPGYKHACLIL